MVQRNPTCAEGEDGSIEITVSGGTTPYSYAWSNGDNVEDPSSLSAGTYQVTVTDANQCQIVSGTVTLTDPAAPVLTINSTTDTECNASVGEVELVSDTDGTITVDGNSQAVSAGIPVTFTGLSAGFYTALFEDANGCQVEESFNINNSNSDLNATAAVTDVSCNGGADGEVVISTSGGVSPFNYELLETGATNSTGTFSNISAGAYRVLVTDDNDCSFNVSFDVDQPSPLLLSVAGLTNVACNGDSDGSVTLIATGGTSPFTYSVDAGPSAGTIDGNQISDLSAGTYTFLVTDDNGCTTTSEVTISEPASGLDITSTPAAITDVSCNGGSDGSIDITVTGGTTPYSYVWSSGDNIEDPTTLSAGTYEVTVTDANGCAIVGGPYEVDEPTEVTATAVVDSDPDCEGNTTGEATVTAGGGTPGYTYLWSDGQTTATASNLSAGTYLVTVTDANGCEAVASVLLVDPTGVEATITSSTNLDCAGDSDGEATVTATGGTAPYSYEWSQSCCSDNADSCWLRSGSVLSYGNGCERLRSGGDRRYYRADGFRIRKHLSGECEL